MRNPIDNDKGKESERFATTTINLIGCLSVLVVILGFALMLSLLLLYPG